MNEKEMRKVLIYIFAMGMKCAREIICDEGNLTDYEYLFNDNFGEPKCFDEIMNNVKQEMEQRKTNTLTERKEASNVANKFNHYKKQERMIEDFISAIKE